MLLASWPSILVQEMAVLKKIGSGSIWIPCNALPLLWLQREKKILQRPHCPVKLPAKGIWNSRNLLQIFYLYTAGDWPCLLYRSVTHLICFKCISAYIYFMFHLVSVLVHHQNGWYSWYSYLFSACNQ